MIKVSVYSQIRPRATDHDRVSEDRLRDIGTILEQRRQAGYATEDLHSIRDIVWLERKSLPGSNSCADQVLK